MSNKKINQQGLQEIDIKLVFSIINTKQNKKRKGKKKISVISYKLTGIPGTYNCVTNSIITWKAILLGVVADQEAKCKIQNMKGHHGYFGCSYCEIKGDYIGDFPRGHVYFPGPEGTKRTRETYVRRSQPGAATNVFFVVVFECIFCCCC